MYELEKKNKVKEFLEREILVSPDILESTLSEIQIKNEDLLYLNNDILGRQDSEINWKDFEKAKTILEKTGDTRLYSQFLEYIGKIDNGKENVKIVKNFDEISEKRTVQDFAMYFNSRLEAIRKILFAREELSRAISISRVLAKRERENVSIIGLVKDKQITKNNNIMLTVEDETGEIKVLVNKNKPDMYRESKDIVFDEVIGIVGVNGENIIFANKVVWPDVPISNELKKSKKEGYALFLSDLHVGSKDFLEEDFKKFLSWINQKSGNPKQKEIASKVKYIFIVGDLVDGVGIYPNQENDLHITDVTEQFNACAKLLAQIPDHIEIIVCAGNHEPMRIAEPQPILPKEFCQSIYDLPNVTLVSNPSVINIHADEDFGGYNVLLYHGYSFDYYVANVDSIRNNGGYDRADLIMKFLLKRRHLGPSHTSTLYVPYTDKDPLAIDIVPDMFASGHIHKSYATHYKNITIICGSCWQRKTDFQEKVGHNPEPSRVPLVNLQTREVKILKFGK